MSYLFENFRTGDYLDIYLWLLFLFVFFGSLIIRHLFYKNKATYLRTDRNILILFVVLIIFLFGTRGIKIGTDTWNYHFFYFLRGIRLSSPFEIFSYFTTDLMFEVIMFFTLPFKNFTVFILTVSIIFNISMYKFVRRYTKYSYSGSSLLMFLMIASSFVFFTHQTNTIRNGLAIPFVLFGIYYMDLKNYKKAFVFLLIAYLCHGTALIPIACILGAHFGEKIKLKYFILLYLFGIGLAMVGFGFNKIAFLASLGADDAQRLFFDGETDYRIGFRPDFVLYNSLFLFVFFKLSTLKNKTDLFLIKYFIFASIIFFFNFGIPFSDRIGVYSWIAIPLLFTQTINNRFGQKSLHYLTLATIGYFTLNFFVLPFL
ncbi:EpsG family protein [Hwangdonia sp.]|uniref:EpsG family protein n=1 Tax=Hwangdonia sp. TaxID=1883432 RepID=UPI003AB5A453